jgi:hypothetical protein
MTPEYKKGYLAALKDAGDRFAKLADDTQREISTGLVAQRNGGPNCDVQKLLAVKIGYIEALTLIMAMEKETRK